MERWTTEQRDETMKIPFKNSRNFGLFEYMLIKMWSQFGTPVIIHSKNISVYFNVIYNKRFELSNKSSEILRCYVCYNTDF